MALPETATLTLTKEEFSAVSTFLGASAFLSQRAPEPIRDGMVAFIDKMIKAGEESGFGALTPKETLGL